MIKIDKSSTFFCHQNIIEVCPDELTFLKKAALEAPFKRSRLCLHHDHNDTVQEMVIAFCKGSYVRPHKHLNKSESFHVIEGSLLVVFFDDEGNVSYKVQLDSYDKKSIFLYRLATDFWHTVIPLTEFVVIHEITAGPFKQGDTKFPSWAPYGDEPEKIAVFTENCLKALVKSNFIKK